MKEKDQKQLWKLKKNDTIYLIDLGDIEKGFQEFKVIKNKRHRETVFSCTCEETVEYYTLEFESPYLDREVTVYKENGFNATLKFTYAWPEDGTVKTRPVYLIITSDIPHGFERAKYEITKALDEKHYNITHKTNLIEKLSYEVEFDTIEVARLGELLKKLNEVKCKVQN